MKNKQLIPCDWVSETIMLMHRLGEEEAFNKYIRSFQSKREKKVAFEFDDREPYVCPRCTRSTVPNNQCDECY
jgi:hypothetical protein